jgi:rhodanese-related sulfurtransferase
MSLRDLKDQLNEQFARIGQALSSPKRLELLELLHQCPKTVETLADNTAMSVANTSRHLQVLRSAGLVDTQRDGVYMIYRLSDEQVYTLVRSMKGVAELRLAEVDRVLADLNADADELEVVDRDQLLMLARTGKVIVLDVRPEDEFTASHLPHAVSIPLTVLTSRMNELPRDQQIVAYCRGPYCVLASEAVRYLKSHGYHAVRLGDGVAEWKAAGQPIVSGQA